jgi:hypothetical protein
MNARQLRKLAQVVSAAAHPGKSPIDGKPYTAAELADFNPYGPPAIGTWQAETWQGREYLTFRLHVTHDQEHDLAITGDGALWQWDTVRIPPEDCDCECRTAAPLVPASRFELSADCPRHSQRENPPWRELDAFLHVDGIGWEIVDRPHPLRHLTRRHSERVGAGVIGVDVPISPSTTPAWRHVIRLGAPAHDVLADYRAERGRA